MSERILCVDDDPNILSAYQRQLRKTFGIDVALGGEEALASIEAKGPYAVIVSDLRMPGMDGIQFLAKARERAPDSVRMMLSGNADLNSTINVVNEGHIFRFLVKPCPPAVFTKALNAGIAQYRLITAEKELLEKTLSSSVKVLIDVLSLVNPQAFGRASRVRRMVRQLSAEMQIERAWQVEVATMLSQLGCVTVPSEVLEKVARGEGLASHEERMFEQHPKVGHDLIASIPRLHEVAEIIAYQEKHYDGCGTPVDERKGEDIPLGARLLHVALDFDTQVSGGKDQRQAYHELRGRNGRYDPKVMSALGLILRSETPFDTILVRIDGLTTQMILDEDVVTSTGVLVVAKGQEVTASLLARLKNYARSMDIRQPFKALVPH